MYKKRNYLGLSEFEGIVSGISIKVIEQLVGNE